MPAVFYGFFMDIEHAKGYVAGGLWGRWFLLGDVNLEGIWGGKGGDMVFRMIVDKFWGEEAGFRGICGECV